MLVRYLYFASRVMTRLGKQLHLKVGLFGTSEPGGLQPKRGLSQRGSRLLSWAALWLVSFGGRLVRWGLPPHRPIGSKV
jgi:hypothetical protein